MMQVRRHIKKKKMHQGHHGELHRNFEAPGDILANFATCWNSKGVGRGRWCAAVDGAKRRQEFGRGAASLRAGGGEVGARRVVAAVVPHRRGGRWRRASGRWGSGGGSRGLGRGAGVGGDVGRQEVSRQVHAAGGVLGLAGTWMRWGCRASDPGREQQRQAVGFGGDTGGGAGSWGGGGGGAGCCWRSAAARVPGGGGGAPGRE